MINNFMPKLLERVKVVLDSYKKERQYMVDTTIAARDITDRDVIEAMLKVPRHLFVPPEIRSYAYQDRPLPIGWGQTISQPYIVAFMAQEAKKALENSDKKNPSAPSKVLEIGTGCGYSASVLAQIFDLVYTVEIIPPLAKESKKTIEKLNYDNIFIRIGDGHNGWPEASPFDAIVITAAPEKLPEKLLPQLKVGSGRMVIPVGPPHDTQMKVITRLSEREFSEEIHFPVKFVPMTSNPVRDEILIPPPEQK